MLLCFNLTVFGPTELPNTDRTQRGKCIGDSTPDRPTFELAVKYILYKSCCSMRLVTFVTGSKVARNQATANCSLSGTICWILLPMVAVTGALTTTAAAAGSCLAGVAGPVI